jgi:hypothetical protein
MPSEVFTPGPECVGIPAERQMCAGGFFYAFAIRVKIQFAKVGFSVIARWSGGRISQEVPIA